MKCNEGVFPSLVAFLSAQSSLDLLDQTKGSRGENPNVVEQQQETKPRKLEERSWKEDGKGKI